MGIVVERPGLLTTVQDLGRPGYQQFGFAPSGALDALALMQGNLLVGNEPGEGALEATLLGPVLTVERANVAAVTGGDCQPRLNGQLVPMYRAFQLRPGDRLELEGMVSGCRSYLAFAGGLAVPPVMGSKSTNLKCGIGGLEGRALRMGDRLAFSAPRSELAGLAQRAMDPPAPPEALVSLRVVLGMQRAAFGREALGTFFSKEYRVSNQSDRMGVRLEGPEIRPQAGVDIVSDGIPLGAVQVPSSGLPIVLLNDRQTTGGYVKLGAVASCDLGRLAQLRMGDRIRFEEISLRGAQRLLRARQREVAALRARLERLK